MSLVKKLKDILFEEEEYTEPVKVVEDVKKEEPTTIKIEEPVEEKPIKVTSDVSNVTSERELFKKENNFRFPEFDEEEFTSNFSQKKQVTKPTSNVLEYERKKTYEKRTDYGRYERVETREITEKKKFKPSPIISPVYGILNQDYKAEDIVKKENDTSNIDIDTVRKKAFEPQEVKEDVEVFDEPVVTFFEEKETVKLKEMPKREEYRSIDDLLEEAGTEIPLEDTLEMPLTNNLDAIEEELEKLEVEPKEKEKDLDDTLDNDLFELIDSMYDDREEE